MATVSTPSGVTLYVPPTVMRPRCTLELLVPDANAGYGAGHNRAMTEVDSRYHLILNPDVELATDAVALALGVLAARDNIVLLAPTGFSPSGKPEFLAKAYPSVWVLGLRAFAPRWLATQVQPLPGTLRDAGPVARRTTPADCPRIGVLHVGPTRSV